MEPTSATTAAGGDDEGRKQAGGKARATSATFDVDGEGVEAASTDDKGFVGSTRTVSNAAWVAGSGAGGWSEQGVTVCEILGRCKEPRRDASGHLSLHYVVRASDDGQLYCVPAHTVGDPEARAKRRRK